VTYKENPWMITASGRKFYPFNPQPEDVDLGDIAHHLSMICRFNGAVSRFYSVAQHSVHCAELILSQDSAPAGAAFHALMHDTAEAYMGDIIHPIKSQIANAKVIEARILNVIYAALGLTLPTPEQEQWVKWSDLCLLSAEFKALKNDSPDLGVQKMSVPFEIETWYGQARLRFLHQFKMLRPS
jgi:hypothetical protein